MSFSPFGNLIHLSITMKAGNSHPTDMSIQSQYIAFLRDFQRTVPASYPTEGLLCRRCGPTPCKYHPPEFKYHPDAMPHLDQLEDGMRAIDQQLLQSNIDVTILPWFAGMLTVFNNADAQQIPNRTPWEIADNVAAYLEAIA